jgi:glyoxalase family protein
VPTEALSFWVNRLETFAIPVKKAERFGEQVIQFDDPHGLQLELVAREEDEQDNWAFGGVTPEVAIKGFGGATLYSSRPEETAETLTNVMGLELVGTEGDYTRFKASADIGDIINLKMVTGVSGSMGVGTVHHIAWRAQDDADHLELQQHAMNHSQHVTELKDRNYFNALYFCESGEILFEIATDPPGFAHDETPETMGTQLMLPVQYEQQREQLVNSHIPIQVRIID